MTTKPRRPSFFVALVTIVAMGCAHFTPAGAAETKTDPGWSGWTKVNDDDAAVKYSPGFQKGAAAGYYFNDMHSSPYVGDWCKFAFNGTAVTWISSKHSDHGKADVFIDGKLDATVDTSSPVRVTQQEVYAKTGLSNGPHELMIQVKTAAYQDVDAFIYFKSPAISSTPKNLGHVSLPDQVPYLNTTPGNYPVGNGIVMAVGNADGDWNQLAGPGYTSPNYIGDESMSLEVDGVEKPLHIEMKRARETGVYYGVLVAGDLEVRMIDYACRGQSSVTRLVMADNTSATASHDVRFRAGVMPRRDPGMTNGFVQDGDHHRCGVAIQADTTVEVPFGGKGATNRSVVISFADPDTTAYLNGDTYILESKLNQVPPHGSCNMALDHYFRRDKTSDSDAVAAIRSAKSVADLEKTITDWQTWFRGVGADYQLSRITDARARDLVEGGLAVLKTNQSQDGGIIAHSTWYKEGYIRDAVLNLRAMSATGHFDELKQFMIWLDHVWQIAGHLPDAAACDVELSDHTYRFDMGNADTEETALYLITARDYYAGTKDLDTLKKLNASLQYCMDIQLKDAAANGYKLEFNGDETEICSAVDISATSSKMGGACQAANWSYSSIGMCAASLDFYIQYLKARGDDPAHYKNSLTGATLDLNAELSHLLKAMDTDFWRTDVAEIPEGFHDSFRRKSDNAWPLKRIVNFTVMPLYYDAPYAADEKAKDASAIAHYFDEKTGFLQLVPGADNGFDGHDLGYLLWALVETGNPKKTEVYDALVKGPTVDAWGSYNEAYDSQGIRNGHDLRSLETGCNLSALAKYWSLGPSPVQK